jgi:hypothetical protein
MGRLLSGVAASLPRRDPLSRAERAEIHRIAP